MPGEVRLFLKRIVILILPFAVYSLAIIIIDPYNYFSHNNIINNRYKQDISFKMNYAMWKLLSYRHAPKPNILLGDSRMMALDPESIQEVSNEDYCNLSYGGGSLREAIATFDYAVKLVDLRSVYIGLDLNSYNGSDNKDRVSEVRAALRNPLLYVSNNNVLLACLRLLQATVTGRPPELGKPTGDKEAFWQKQLDTTARVYYANYRDPVRYREELARISAFCRSRNIRLVFIIFPSHTDLRNKIHEYGLESADLRLREDLEKFGLVYDFAADNETTRNRELFTDPYHFGAAIKERIVLSVWGDAREDVKVFGQPTVPQ
jgi:hypothetical protein